MIIVLYYKNNHTKIYFRVTLQNSDISFNILETMSLRDVLIDVALHCAQIMDLDQKVN